MEPIAPFGLAAIFIIGLLGVHFAQKYLTGSSTDTLTCNGDIAQVKAALEQLLITKPINCQGTPRYWGPAKTINESNDSLILTSSRILL